MHPEECMHPEEEPCVQVPMATVTATATQTAMANVQGPRKRTRPRMSVTKRRPREIAIPHG